MPGLFVESLTLSHFRSHKATRICLDGRPVAMFGPNGAGKTNILEAVSLLSPGRGLRGARAEQLARHPEGLGWKVTAGLRGGGRLQEIVTSAQPGQQRTVTVEGKAVPQSALGRLARVLWLVPAMDRLWTESAEGRRRFLDRMTLSFHPAHGDAVLGYEKAMRERNRLLRDQVHDNAWYGAVEAQMARAGAQIVANRRLALERIAKATEGAQTAFPAARLELEETGDADEAGLLADFAAGRRRDMVAGRTLAGPHRSDLLAVYAAKEVPAAQCSTGEQKALLISLVLANTRALADDLGAAPILLLDEVAAHLDADRRAALYDEVTALRAQAWMTGTGADLFEALGDRAERFRVSERDGTSHIEEWVE